MEGTILDGSAVPRAKRPVDSQAAGLSLLFPAGSRPDVLMLKTCLSTLDGGPVGASVGYQPDPQEGWVELIASGLTFDICGLAPAEGQEYARPSISYGFSAQGVAERLEGVELFPGGHIAAGAGLAPVVRTLIGLAANLALQLPVSAIAWHPAGTLIEPAYFARITMNWLAGGAFPALGLTALVQGQDGSIASRGLAHFIGQEVQVEGRAGETPADATKLAVRVIDYLVRSGPLKNICKIDTGAGTVRAEPSQFAGQIWVWRDE